MKNIILISGFIFALTLSANARKIYIENETITATNGCVFRVNGWIDVSIEFGWPPISVNSYDITMSGPCGTYHFKGIVHRDENGNFAIQGELINLETMEKIEFWEFIEFHEIIYFLERSYCE